MNITLRRTIEKLKSLESQFNGSKNPVYRMGILAAILNELKTSHEELSGFVLENTQREMYNRIDEEFQKQWDGEI